MSERKERFIPFETIDYVATINQALQRVFDARANVRDSISFERYLRAVEALYVILIPKLRPREAKDLLLKARRRDPEYGYYTYDNLEKLDQAVEKIIEVLDKNNLLIHGEWKRTEEI